MICPACLTKEFKYFLGYEDISLCNHLKTAVKELGRLKAEEENGKKTIEETKEDTK